MNIESMPASDAMGRESMARLAALAEEYHRDPEIRKQLHDDPRGFLAERDYHLPANMDVRFTANSPGVFHVVFPPDPNVVLDDEALSFVSGGKTAGTAGTLGTASTFPSCASTASTVGTAGSAGGG